MARRKNTRRFDPRYFMDEKTDILTEAGKPLPDDPGPIVRDPMAPMKNPEGWDKYWADDEAQSRELENAPITGTYYEQGVNDAKRALSDTPLNLKPRYMYPSDILPSGKPIGQVRLEDYKEGFYDVLDDADDAEAERVSAVDDYYAELEAAPLDPQEEWEQEDRYRS